MPSSCLLMTVCSKLFSAFKNCAYSITAVVNHSTCLELGGHDIICSPHYQCQSIAPFYLAPIIVPVKTKPNKISFSLNSLSCHCCYFFLFLKNFHKLVIILKFESGIKQNQEYSVFSKRVFQSCLLNSIILQGTDTPVH